jgi:hypothetical protein
MGDPAFLLQGSGGMKGGVTWININRVEVAIMKIFTALPDQNICRNRMVSADFFECLVKRPNPKFCSYSMSMGNGFLCKHPQRSEFVKK